MKCKNCKAYNKPESICDAGIACYVLRCGEYGCALNGKTVDKFLRMKKAATNADRIRAMSDTELAEFLKSNRGGCRALTTESYVCDYYTNDLNTDCDKCWLDWLKQEVENE